MKTQMKFQKILCLVLLILGALAVLLSFVWQTGAFAGLGAMLNNNTKKSKFKAAEGKYDATLYTEVQGFNNVMMYCGIVMILLAVLLYITACNKRRNYYISNYVATGLCAGGNIVMSLVLMIMNGMWLGKFRNVDFVAWKARNDRDVSLGAASTYNDSIAWFIVAFVVYTIIIVASVMLILNLVWKIKLMNGEKRLLNGQTVSKNDEPLNGETAEEVAQ